MEASDLLLMEREGRVALLTLNRPERRNALSGELLGQISETLAGLGGDAGVSVVVLAANGNVFTAGHDLGELADGSIASNRRLFRVCIETMERIQGIPQPVIAMVQGLATAAGCQLSASCDLVIAGESARFATPGVRIGYFCVTPMVALTRSVGRKKAMEMLLTGEPLAAQDALVHGLVNRVVPDAQLRDETMALARRIAEAPLAVLAEGKRAFYHQIEQDQRTAYRYAQEIMAATALCEEAQEGIQAFMEKRRPRWEK